MPEYNMTIFQLHAKRRVRQVLHNLTLHLDDIVFCHVVYQPPSEVLKLAFFSSDSYCCDIK